MGVRGLALLSKAPAPSGGQSNISGVGRSKSHEDFIGRLLHRRLRARGVEQARRVPDQLRRERDSPDGHEVGLAEPISKRQQLVAGSEHGLPPKWGTRITVAPGARGFLGGVEDVLEGVRERLAGGALDEPSSSQRQVRVLPGIGPGR